MRLLLVEDDLRLAQNIQELLTRLSYAVDQADTVSLAKDKLASSDYDLIILDWMLPDGSGLDICQYLRADSISTPVLILTAKSQLEDKISGFDVGADDYLTKPFAVPELLARIRALIRRPKIVKSPILSIADLKIDTNLKQVWRANRLINLSPKEYGLLEYLAYHHNQAVERLDLLSHVWDENANLFSNTVDVHIRYLRQKIDSHHPIKLIKTIKGKGYALCDL